MCRVIGQAPICEATEAQLGFGLTQSLARIQRDDLDSYGHTVRDSRLLAIPLLVDTEDGATSPGDVGTIVDRPRSTARVDAVP